jgi:hypothetical protein
MALARVVTFDGVGADRMEAMRSRIGSEGRPEDIPASEILFLYDESAQRALAVLFFDNEDDYAKGDAALSAMPADETPGTRSSVDKYEVAARMTA